MKAKNSNPTLWSSLCFFISLLYLACADEKNCCSFQTNDCSDMFRGTGIPLECHQGVEFPRQDGDCLPVVTEDNTVGQIELVDVEIMYKVKCPSQFINEESRCESSSNLNYIGLNVTFRITAGSIEGIQFNLQTVEGEVKPIVGTLKESCHNLNFSGVLTADMAGDRLFSYTNYVGLHPNSSYNLMARTFNNANSTQLHVSIPGCRQMKDCELTHEFQVADPSECDNFGKWYDDFFCSIPSPAGFSPDIWVYQNLSTVATIWNGNPQLSSYVLTLSKCYSSTCKEDEELLTEMVPIRSGQETLHHQFSVNLPAGWYFVKLYGQPDDICVADQHWGSSLCPSKGCTLELFEDVNHCKNPRFCQSDPRSQCALSRIDDKEVASCECIKGSEINETSGLCECIKGSEINETSGLCEGPCIPNPCQNGGFCLLDNSLEGFTCQCGRLFSGPTCEDGPCIPNPCQNGGFCLLDNSLEGFTCQCGPLLSGPTCEDGATPGGCDSLECLNGGTCYNLSSLGLPTRSLCSCAPMYTGRTCADRIDLCTPNPCQNGGTCFLENNGTAFRCECSLSFMGDRCQVDLCTPNPCQNGGTCFLENDGAAFRCECSLSFMGDRCQVDLCTPNPCQNGGTCYLENDGTAFRCECSLSFMGDRCQEQIIYTDQIIPVWMIMSIALSITVVAAAIVSCAIFVVKTFCCRSGDEKPVYALDVQTVTSDSEIAHLSPVSLILEPPPQPRGPLESIEGGSEEPLMDTFLRSI